MARPLIPADLNPLRNAVFVGFTVLLHAWAALLAWGFGGWTGAAVAFVTPVLSWAWLVVQLPASGFAWTVVVWVISAGLLVWSRLVADSR